MKLTTFTRYFAEILAPLVVVLVGMLASGCGSTSDILIAPQQKFILGGGENGVFRVSVVNRGGVPVRILERLEYGESINLGFLTLGERRQLKFLAGSAAVFSNPTTDTVYVKLRVKGQKGLTREYKPR